MERRKLSREFKLVTKATPVTLYADWVPFPYAMLANPRLSGLRSRPSDGNVGPRTRERLRS